jgi:alkanesulfonate monooxygenase SsuD/methylene tetrahydromethanopterin reductase-like flavin-dependent oxidoreductase (luciferase family)
MARAGAAGWLQGEGAGGGAGRGRPAAGRARAAHYRALMALRIFTEPQQGASYDQLLDVARTAEECGFDAFFRSDHFLKMGSASGLPAYTDAWTTLAGLARDTSRIRLGTLVTPVTFRPVGTFPAVVAEVDHMSHGRLEVGLGAGWWQEEHEAYGLAFPGGPARYDLLEDQLAILHGLWSAAPGAVFERRGLTANVRLEADPLRPAQRPHPPVVLGGKGGPRNSRLAASYADEFNVSFVAVDEMRTTFDSVGRACEAQGRDPGSMVWSVGLVVCCGKTQDEVARRAAAIGRKVPELRQNGLAGSPAEVLDKLGVFAAAGAERFYLQVLDLSDLDHLRVLAEEVQPHAPGR